MLVADSGARDLLGALEAIRIAHRWTDAEFASQLGVSRPMWSMARKGSTKFSRRTLTEILRVFPRLQPEVLDYVSEAGLETNEPEPTAA